MCPDLCFLRPASSKFERLDSPGLKLPSGLSRDLRNFAALENVVQLSKVLHLLDCVAVAHVHAVHSQLRQLRHAVPKREHLPPPLRVHVQIDLFILYALRMKQLQDALDVAPDLVRGGAGGCEKNYFGRHLAHTSCSLPGG
eukprot:CAMPEP_0206139196 /NCGR_PEP_ID=MMETSP1473-20131121/4899_1 /ASSEMBLY_ACC=CAM_ASM_001109 /TAXON_ID=1461547 /ORGANISM="Stichococcus sp, Strain RCC1054" /LENGTH=140 /DNA_ID=CAMNT_0053532861 /DNA_START=208 /DNA_END=630 /DNA_ORIENTATION=+